MDENIHNIDHLFKKAMEGHEEVPSSNVWENIDKNLDKNNVVSISRKYRKLKWVAASLLIFSAGMAMYTVQTRLKNKELAKSISKKKMAESSAERNYADFQKTPLNDAEPSASQVAQDPAVITNKSDSAKATVDSNEAIIKADKQSVIDKLSARVAPTKAEDAKTAQTAKNVKNQLRITETTEEPLPVNKAIKDKSAAVVKNNTNEVFSISKEDAKNVETNSYNPLTGLKAVDHLTSASERQKNLMQIQPAGLLFEKLLRSASQNNTIPAGEPMVLAKNSKVKGYRKSLFSVTVFYSPDFVDTRVDNDQRGFREDDRNEIKNKEKILRTSSVGVLIDYNLSSRWSVQSGISFSSMTTNIQPKIIFARADPHGNINYRFNCSSGYSFVTLRRGTAPALGDSVVALASAHTLNYVSVPLTIKYVFSKGKLSLSPGLGIAANFLNKGKIETEIAGSAGTEKASIDHIQGLNNSYFSGLVSLGAEYSLNKTFALSFTPTGRIALSAINKDTPVKTYLNSFGLATGLRISF
jgi:hypothetical protein